MRTEESKKDIEPTFVDLFSGCGGLSLGFLQARYRCLLAVDNDPKAVECYNMNLKGKKDAGAILEDLNSFKTHKDVISFLELQGVDPASCDVLIGGSPCQSFSVAGRNKIRNLMSSGENRKAFWDRKNKERISLFEVYVLFLEVLTPRWFMFENVPTIQSHEMFPVIFGRFRNLTAPSEVPLSYELHHGNFLASNYGVPQNRKRFIMVGYRRNSNIVGWNRPSYVQPVTVEEALDDLPDVPYGHMEQSIPYRSIPITEYQMLMRGGGQASINDLVSDHICRWHNPDDVALFGKMKPGARFADEEVQNALVEINPKHKLIKYSKEKFKDKLHKLNPDRPAWTVTAHLQKDCYKFIHYRQPRTITVREAARLQSFPDWFRFDRASMCASFQLIGNAVPPLLAQVFAESFLISDPFLLGLDRFALAQHQELAESII